MFGSRKRPTTHRKANPRETPKGPVAWDIPIFFGIMFVLSIIELGFTIDSFIYLQRTHQWDSNTERARLGFLAFSAARTILLSAVYIGFHFARKHFHSMFHTFFLVISTGLWIASGVVIHQMWGIIECGGVGALQGGLSECHELKIIEIIAWVIAAVSVLAAIPVVVNAMKKRKRQMESRRTHKTAVSG